MSRPDSPVKIHYHVYQYIAALINRPEEVLTGAYAMGFEVRSLAFLQLMDYASGIILSS